MRARGAAAELIRKKRDGALLSDEAISELVAGIVDGSVSDAQIAAFAMAVFFRGMTRAECASLSAATALRAYFSASSHRQSPSIWHKAM